MAVLFDAVGAGGAIIGTGNPTWTHTASGSARYVIVAIAVGQITPSGSYATSTRTATYGGVSMTSLGAVNSNNGTSGWVELFGLANPLTGARTVAVAVTGSPSTTVGNSVSYTGVGSLGTPVTSYFLDTTPSVTVSSATGRRVISAFCAGAPISAPTQTQRYLNNYDSGSAGGNLLIQDATGAASVSLGAADNNDWFGCIGVDVLATAVSTTGYKRWNGSSWVDTATVRRWDGAAWSTVPDPI